MAPWHFEKWGAKSIHFFIARSQTWQKFFSFCFIFSYFIHADWFNSAFDYQESRKQNIFGCWPCSRKHVLKYYYDQRDILLESDSQGVLEQEVPSLDSCNGLSHNLISIPRLSGLQRHLIGEGSHRRLHSSMRFDFPSDADSILSLSSCEAVIIERLPLGVFADPFELQHLVQRGGKQSILLF